MYALDCRPSAKHLEVTINLDQVYHGVNTPVTITDPGRLFSKDCHLHLWLAVIIPWVINAHTIPSDLTVDMYR